MNTLKWNDGLLPAGRYPRLYLTKAGEACKFVGKNIPGFVAIAAADYQKSGKWSNTTYTLLLAPGVRAVELVSPMHGTWGDSFASWGELIAAIGLPLAVAREIVRAEFASTAQRLDALEAFAAEAEASGGVVEVVVVCFGSPTRRQRADGFWDSPKSAATSTGVTVTVAPGEVNGWESPVVLSPQGASILDSTHAPGMGGGYWTVKVAVST